jgi:hypothetical protein
MLKRTIITDAGVKKLQHSLPDCEIIHSPRNSWPAELGPGIGRWSVEFASDVKQNCEFLRRPDRRGCQTEAGRWRQSARPE